MGAALYKRPYHHASKMCKVLFTKFIHDYKHSGWFGGVRSGGRGVKKVVKRTAGAAVRLLASHHLHSRTEAGRVQEAEAPEGPTPHAEGPPADPCGAASCCADAVPTGIDPPPLGEPLYESLPRRRVVSVKVRRVGGGACVDVTPGGRCRALPREQSPSQIGPTPWPSWRSVLPLLLHHAVRQADTC